MEKKIKKVKTATGEREALLAFMLLLLPDSTDQKP